MKKQRIIIAMLIFGILISIGTIGYMVYSQTPKMKLKKQMKLGNRFLTEQDYEDAILAFDKALAIEPKNESAISGMVTAYTEIGKSLEKEGNLTEEYKRLQDGYKKTDDESLNDLFFAPSSDVKNNIDQYLKNGNSEELLKLMDSDEYTDYTKRISISGGRVKDKEEIINEMADRLDNRGDQESEYNLLLKIYDKNDPKILDQFYKADYDILEKIEGLVIQENYDAIISEIISDEFAGIRKKINITERTDILTTGQNDFIIYNLKDINKENGIGLYFGTTKNGIREGNNCRWIVCNDTGSFKYHADGSWHNDKPNGQFTEVQSNYEFNDIDVDHINTGNVVDGSWDGQVIETNNFPDGTVIKWVHNYINGKIVVLRIDGQGKNVVSEQAIVNTTQRHIGYHTYYDVTSTYGIAGFEKVN